MGVRRVTTSLKCKDSYFQMAFNSLKWSAVFRIKGFKASLDSLNSSLFFQLALDKAANYYALSLWFWSQKKWVIAEKNQSVLFFETDWNQTQKSSPQAYWNTARRMLDKMRFPGRVQKIYHSFNSTWMKVLQAKLLRRVIFGLVIWSLLRTVHRNLGGDCAFWRGMCDFFI